MKASHPPLIIGNWKMNLDREETGALAIGVKNVMGEIGKSVHVIVSPSFPYLQTTQEILKGTSVGIAGQNMFWEQGGAYTGEVSAAMLAEFGCRYVILGHSERRRYLHESDVMVHQKVAQASAAKLTPIVCIGETFEERQQGTKELVVMKQLQAALEGLTPSGDQRIVIAYEPVWAIGSGQACDPQEAKDTIKVIAQSLMDLYSEQIASKHFTLIYGGSVDAGNVRQYVDGGLIHGVLVGGASSVLDSFVGIIAAVS